MSCSDGTADHDSNWLSEMEPSESESESELSSCSEDQRIVQEAPSTPPSRMPRAPLAHAPADSEEEADGETLGSCDTPLSQRGDEEYDKSGDDESFISETEDLPADALEHMLSAIRRRRVALLSLP